MTGWVIFAVAALVLLLSLRFAGRVRGPALMLVGAALALAAAGYAWQGSPGLPGAPVDRDDRPMRPDGLYAMERQRLLDHYDETGIVLGTADAFNRSGQDEAAAGLLRNAVRKHPDNVDLRIGYAHALLVVAAGNMTPAVNLAFDEADRVAKPGDPRPAYFRGLAHIETGDLAGGERIWRDIAARLPKGSPWGRTIEDRLRLFDMIDAQRTGADVGAAGAPNGNAALRPGVAAD